MVEDGDDNDDRGGGQSDVKVNPIDTLILNQRRESPIEGRGVTTFRLKNCVAGWQNQHWYWWQQGRFIESSSLQNPTPPLPLSLLSPSVAASVVASLIRIEGGGVEGVGGEEGATERGGQRIRPSIYGCGRGRGRGRGRGGIQDRGR